MERTLQFNFDRTRWFACRRNLWGLFVHVTREDDSHVNLEVDLAVNQSVVTPRRFTVAVEEGVSLPVGEAYCASDEEFIIWCAAAGDESASIGFEHEEGVEFIDVTEDAGPAAGSSSAQCGHGNRQAE